MLFPTIFDLFWLFILISNICLYAYQMSLSVRFRKYISFVRNFLTKTYYSSKSITCHMCEKTFKNEIFPCFWIIPFVIMISRKDVYSSNWCLMEVLVHAKYMASNMWLWLNVSIRSSFNHVLLDKLMMAFHRRSFLSEESKWWRDLMWHSHQKLISSSFHCVWCILILIYNNL